MCVLLLTLTSSSKKAHSGLKSKPHVMVDLETVDASETTNSGKKSRHHSDMELVPESTGNSCCSVNRYEMLKICERRNGFTFVKWYM